MTKILLRGREKAKIGAVFVSCVVFSIPCVANFRSVETDCRLKKAEKTKKESHQEKDSDKKVPAKTGSIYTTMTSLNLANAEPDSDEDNFQVGLYMTNTFSAED